MITIKGTKSVAIDEKGNEVDAGLEDSASKSSNPDGFKEKIHKSLETTEEIVEEVLKDNLDLRKTKFRKLIRIIVEDKLGKELPEGSIDRACRKVQSNPPAGKGLWKVEDNTELAETHKEYYSKGD